MFVPTHFLRFINNMPRNIFRSLRNNDADDTTVYKDNLRLAADPFSDLAQKAQ